MSDAFSRCHPIINLIYFFVVIGFTMFVQHPVFLVISFVAACFYGVMLNGAKKVLKMNLLLTLPGLLIVTILNPLFNHYGVTPLLYIESSGNWITLETIVYGVVLGCVMFIVILWFSCYNTVMTSDKFIYLFGRIIPAMSLVLSMALRFVPRFANQMKIIRNSQKCIGRDISNAGILKKARYGLNMVSILVTWALENAIDTADSMKSRGYGIKGRTAFSIYKFDKRDKWISVVFAILIGIIVYGCSKGVVFAQYNPRILLAGFEIQGRTAPIEGSVLITVTTFLAYAIFCFLPPIIGLVENISIKNSQRSVGKEIAITYRSIYEEMAGEATE